MRLKRVFFEVLLITFFCILIFSVRGCRTKVNEKTNSKNKFEIPVYRDANKIKYFDENDSTIGVDYQVKIDYPAKDLIRFYEDAMSSRGFKTNKSLDMQDCDGEWSYYVDGTIESRPSVASINLCWTDDDKIALLLLKYYYFEKNNSPVILETLDDLEVKYYLLAH